MCRAKWFFCVVCVTFPGGAMVKNPPANAEVTGNMGFIPGSWRVPSSRKRQPTPVLLFGKFRGQQSLGPLRWGWRELSRRGNDWAWEPAKNHSGISTIIMYSENYKFRLDKVWIDRRSLRKCPYHSPQGKAACAWLVHMLFWRWTLGMPGKMILSFQ